MDDVSIMKKLLTPEQNDAEIERRNEEKRRRDKEILGIHCKSYQFRLLPLNSG
jgi:hypothetical protein